ncbi:hypothetical protein OSB04_010073 [Centaurea solstitialis]|uniref:F-box domain-containing protein n=1 Tax=Centaurea solstitialis TaxID=347529 RepID=A0AA38T8I3_9ASTR|nr:hypothetical protein OSB04_010073 [Centaurea solstitialis]
MANRKRITPPELSPEIVLFHILPKQPAKSLLRFKCVCKQWRSFLTSPLFANIHLTTVDHHRHEKVIFLGSRLPSTNNFQTIDCEDGLIAEPRCYPFAGYDPILTSSVNGVILSLTIDGNVYIYSLRSDSWRKLKSTLEYEDRIPYAGDHNFLDEKLHFLRPLQLDKKRRYIIIRLDLKTEKFTEIVVPPSCGHRDLSLMVVRGCIELTIFKEALWRTWMIKMWRMNGNGD